MMHSLTIFEKKKSFTDRDFDVIRYLGSGALTKKWSDGFSKSLVETLGLANKIANYPRFQIVVVFSLAIGTISVYKTMILKMVLDFR